MEKNNSNHYQESKNVHDLGLTFAYSICTVFALVLGYTYSVLIAVIPFVYANLFLTFIFGVSLTLLLRVLIRLTHNRSKRSQVFLAIITGLLANYFQWTGYVLFALNGNAPSFTEFLQNLHWLIFPENLFQLILEINKHGMWSLGDITFTGWMLTIIWLLEAIIIGAIPVVGVLTVNTYPYSENLNKWYPKYTLLKDFESLSLIERMTNSLMEDPASTIETLGKGDGIRHSKVHLYYLEEEDYQYISIENIFIEDQGRGKTNKTLMVNNLRIDSKSMKSILEKYEYKKERIEII